MTERDYDPAANGYDGYQLARALQREALLRARAWKAIGPRDDTERRIAEGEE